MTACSVDISERIYRLSAIGQPGASVTCPSVTRQGRPRPTVRYSRSAIADGRRLHVVEGLLAGRRRAGIGDGALQGRQMRPECGMRDRLHVPEMPDQLAAESRERSEEHTSELQSLMRISYAVFCLKKQNNTK